MSEKRRISDLALFGGPVGFPGQLHVGRPNFGDREAFYRRCEQVFASARFTNDGPLVRELEAKLAELTKTSHALAVCNATVGLQLVARALELAGEVVVPAFTFVATAHAFRFLGIEPAFADIDSRTHGIDPASARATLSARSSAIVGVHTWGIPCDVAALEAVARERGIPLILDAAPALGCAGERGPVGSSGAAEVFSLHATKVVNSFEGGIVTTNDPDLAARLRRLRDFGFSGRAYDEVVQLGTNAKMSELHAAAGLTTLEALPRILEENTRCAERYRAALRGVPALSLLELGARGRSNHQYVVAVLDAASPVARDALVRALHAEGVIVRRYFYPGCHRSAPYVERPSRPELPVTDRVAASVVCLPTGPSVDDASIDRIASLVRLVLERADEFNQRFARLDG